MKKNNKKGGIAILSIIVTTLVFLMLFPFLAPTINTQGQNIVVNNSLTGIPAFLLLNLNLSIFIMLLMVILSAGLLGSVT